MATTPASAAPGAPEAQPPTNPVGRIFGVAFSPKATFEDIAQRPGTSWVVPMVLMVVLGVTVSTFLNKKMDWESYIRSQAEKSPRFAQLSEEQKRQAISRQAQWSPYVSYGIGALRYPTIVLIASLFYLGAFNVLSGAGLRYGQSFSITAFANALPGIVASLLIIITLALKRYGDVNPETMLASHLGVLMSSDAPTWQRSLGSSVELFDLWGNVLAAIGFAAARPKKISTGNALAIIFGLWLLWVLIKVGVALIFS